MKKLFGKKILRLFTFISVCVLITGCSGESKQANTAALTLHDYQGHEINLAEHRGKWVILNFWASWCKPCRQEIPSLSRFYQQHHQQALVIGVGMDPTDAKQAAELQQDLHISYPLVFEDVASKLGVDVSYMPTTVFINPKGEIVKTEVKEQTVANLVRSTGIAV